MRVLLLAALFAGAQTGPSAAPSPAASPPDATPRTATSSATVDSASAPRPLFDGQSLAGWRVFAPEGDSATTWTVADGTLVSSGAPIGYLATEKTFTNFELTLEWRFDPAKGAGNSGVLLRVQQPDQVWPRSIEAQLHSQNAGDIWNIGEFPLQPDAARTEGRRTRKAEPTNEKPLGEWNRYRIVLNGGTLELYVNDVLQNRASGAEEIPGRIALQAEGAHIEFRNIALRELTPAPANEASKDAKREAGKEAQKEG